MALLNGKRGSVNVKTKLNNILMCGGTHSSLVDSPTLRPDIGGIAESGRFHPTARSRGKPDAYPMECLSDARVATNRVEYFYDFCLVRAFEIQSQPAVGRDCRELGIAFFEYCL